MSIVIKHDTLDILIQIFPSLFSEAIEMCVKLCLPMYFNDICLKKNCANFTLQVTHVWFSLGYDPHSIIGIVYLLQSVGT